MAKSKTTHPEGGVEKFLVLPIIVLILAQMGTSGDNGALGLANQQLVDVLGATTPDIQLANMVYSLMAGAFIPMAFSLHGSEVNGLMWLGLAVAGAGAGIVSAQANNIVALAVNERDASQSGGIQTTMRNVGQAIGVAAIGAVLLFGITANIDNAMADSPVITPEIRTAVAERNISLMGDAQFEQTIADIPMDDAQRAELVQLNSDARIQSTITSYVVSGVLILLGLFTTRWITIFKKDEDGKEETIVAETADEMPFEPVVDREM